MIIGKIEVKEVKAYKVGNEDRLYLTKKEAILRRSKIDFNVWYEENKYYGDMFDWLQENKEVILKYLV